MLHKVEVVCHKGANKQAPENTFAAARLCLAWGADTVEIDVHTSKDGVLYLFHGPYLEKTTNGSGWIGSYTSQELDQLDAGSWFKPEFAGERIPRLDAFLGWLRGKGRVYFDVKNADPRQLADLIAAHGFQQDCFLWAKDREWMRRLHEIEPGLALKVNVKNVEEAARAKEEFDAHLVEVGVNGLTPEMVAACHQRGMRVMVNYEENDPTVFRRMIAGGADMINTDYADVFLAILNEG
jgi:glycerophosphoryl diester phosphodiesterase